jgi:hypothetical protein
VSRNDALDLALRALEELGEGGDSAETDYAFNAINAFTPPAPEKAEPPARQTEGADAINAINAITPARSPGVGHLAPPGPGARCERHRRLLTFSEQLFGACSWCVWQDRRGADGNRP